VSGSLLVETFWTATGIRHLVKPCALCHGDLCSVLQCDITEISSGIHDIHVCLENVPFGSILFHGVVLVSGSSLPVWFWCDLQFALICPRRLANIATPKRPRRPSAQKGPGPYADCSSIVHLKLVNSVSF
jgi:hypothetical protein